MDAITPNAPKQPKARKPRPKPERCIRVIEQPTADTDGWGAVEIQVGKNADLYLVRFLPTDFGAGGMGFEIEKLDTDLTTVETYTVHLSDEARDCFCTCKGCERWGHCKHSDGLQALRRAGKLLPIPSDDGPDTAA